MRRSSSERSQRRDGKRRRGDLDVGVPSDSRVSPRCVAPRRISVYAAITSKTRLSKVKPVFKAAMEKLHMRKSLTEIRACRRTRTRNREAKGYTGWQYPQQHFRDWSYCTTLSLLPQHDSADSQRVRGNAGDIGLVDAVAITHDVQ